MAHLLLILFILYATVRICQIMIFIAHTCNLLIMRPGCATNYHHNYSVSGAFRTYYGGVPDMIQVSEYQFIHRSSESFHWIDVILMVRAP
jgi:hypothetical protein